ncbi:DUF2628 domain-containing protein [Roseibium suaedae]|uniref:DUF2628 domain-containing protein n=1 Tax=Roseibium suaedae TaxID=735517 RepID=A0A1M7MED2_9HYPH|nr:DUF2628 domain-containing protein [Roseibium suaedae]SHM89256.1 Protein of unknown function [Roseibium suaedae]
MSSTYYVMAPPDLKDPVASPHEADRLVFVPDRFSWPAFAFSIIWILWNRLWLVLLGYLVVTLVLETAAAVTGGAAPMVAGLAVSILFGFEANSLRRWSMERAGWRVLGLACGSDETEAELRFFHAMQNKAAGKAVVRETPAPIVRLSGIIPRIGTERVVGLPLGQETSR